MTSTSQLTNEGPAIHRLPLEIIVDIWLLALLEVPTDIHAPYLYYRSLTLPIHYYLTLFNLSQVCSAWLFHIKHQPHLWCYIHTDDDWVPVTRAFARSADLPLTVRIDTAALSKWYHTKEKARLFCEHISRWEDVTIQLGETYWDLEIDLDKTPAPKLKKLNLKGYRGMVDRLFGGITPLLRHLALGRHSLQWNKCTENLLLQRLESLEFDLVRELSLHQLLKILSRCPALEILQLIRTPLVAETRPLDVVTLSSLKVLRIHGAASQLVTLLLSHIVTPKCSNLSILYKTFRYKPPHFDIDSLPVMTSHITSILAIQPLPVVWISVGSRIRLCSTGSDDARFSLHFGIAYTSELLRWVSESLVKVALNASFAMEITRDGSVALSTIAEDVDLSFLRILKLSGTDPMTTNAVLDTLCKAILDRETHTSQWLLPHLEEIHVVSCQDYLPKLLELVRTRFASRDSAPPLYTLRILSLKGSAASSEQLKELRALLGEEHVVWHPEGVCEPEACIQ